MSQPQPVELESLSPQEIDYVRKSIEEEIGFLDESLKSLHFVVQRFGDTRASLTALEPEDEGKDTFIPLTSSLYVPGNLKNVNKFKVDIGAGFFAEKTRDEAIDYYTRKIQKLLENSEQLKKLLTQKSRDLDQVESVLQRKLYQLQNAK
jgi:prefoldin alpha subunit